MPRSPRCWVRTVVLAAGLTLALGASVVAEDAPAPPRADSKDALPPDGAWARYSVMAKEDGRSLKCTIAFLGGATHEGEACRWIELTIESLKRDDGVAVRDVVVKWLVTEKNLLESDLPIRVVTCERRGFDGNVVEVTNESHRNLDYFAAFLPGPRRHARKLDGPQLVKYQKGNLQIATGLAGRYAVPVTADDLDPDGATSYITDYSIWLHPDLPVGFAYAKGEMFRQIGDKPVPFGGEWECFLEDTGTDAKPSF